MQVENKGKDGYKSPFYAKLIMSMNEFPKIKMDSDVSAWQSRFNIIHFKHKFEKNPNYDAWEQENLKTQEAVEWLLQQAAIAIHNAIIDGEFCYNDNEQFNTFLENNAPFMYEALSKTFEEWSEYNDVRNWFNAATVEYGVQMSLKTFVNTFNKQSDKIEIYRTKRKKGDNYLTAYVVRNK